MKKKKIISLISSILCSIAIVGLFCLSSFSNYHKQNKIEVSASMSLNDLTGQDVSFVTSDIGSFYPSMYTYLINNMNGFDIVNTYPHYYDFDYYVSGYVNGNLFERIRVRVTYANVFSGDNTYYNTYIQFMYGTNNEFTKWDNPPSGVYYTPRVCIEYSYKNWTIGGNGFVGANIYDYILSASTLNFVNGSDITNVGFLYLLNLCCDYVGMNTYTVDNITASQYEDMITGLNGEISTLQSEINSLSSQVDNAYYSGYYSAQQYYEQEYENNMASQYSSGYTDGYNDGFNVNTTATTIFSGILTVGMVPINFFLAIFNFEILGINLSYFIRALFTVLLILIVVKFVIGNLGGSD